MLFLGSVTEGIAKPEPSHRFGEAEVGLLANGHLVQGELHGLPNPDVIERLQLLGRRLVRSVLKLLQACKDEIIVPGGCDGLRPYISLDTN